MPIYFLVRVWSCYHGSLKPEEKATRILWPGISLKDSVCFLFVKVSQLAIFQFWVWSLFLTPCPMDKAIWSTVFLTPPKGVSIPSWSRCYCLPILPVTSDQICSYKVFFRVSSQIFIISLGFANKKFGHWLVCLGLLLLLSEIFMFWSFTSLSSMCHH